jgi:hypothetical protein
MQHVPHDDVANRPSYEPPRITDIGTVADVALAFNKMGSRSDICSNLAPSSAASFPSDDASPDRVARTGASQEAVPAITVRAAENRTPL